MKKEKTLAQLEGQKNQDAKNMFLLTSLKTIISELTAREVFTEANGLIQTWGSELEEAGKEIEKLLQGSRYHNGGITINGEGCSYTINFSSAAVLLKDLQEELKRDWDKVTYVFDCFEKGNGIKRKFPTYSLPKEYELNEKTHYGIARQFNSAQEVPQCDDYKFAMGNLETAIKAKAFYEQGGTDLSSSQDCKANAKKMEKVIAYWQLHANAWANIARVAEGLDYLEIIEERRQEEVRRAADENEAIAFIQENATKEFPCYIGTTRLYLLFKEKGLVPTKDMNLARILVLADEISNRKKMIWNEDRTNVVSERKITFDEYFNETKEKNAKELQDYNNTYIRKDGKPRSVSYGQRQKKYAQEGRIRDLEELISFLAKNEQDIKRFMDQKSVYCSEVLQLMDQDKSYQEALSIVLEKHITANKKELEEELNLYI